MARFCRCCRIFHSTHLCSLPPVTLLKWYLLFENVSLSQKVGNFEVMCCCGYWCSKITTETPSRLLTYLDRHCKLLWKLVAGQLFHQPSCYGSTSINQSLFGWNMQLMVHSSMYSTLAEVTIHCPGHGAINISISRKALRINWKTKIETKKQ